MGLILQKNTCLRLSTIIFAFLSQLGKIVNPEDIPNNSISLFDEWKAGHFIQNAAIGMGMSQQETLRIVKMVRVLISMQKWIDDPANQEPAIFVQSALTNSDVQHILQMNRYQDILWYSKEGFDDFINCLMVSVVFEPDISDPSMQYERLVLTREVINTLQDAAAQSDFQVEKLIQALERKSAQAS